MGLRLNSLVFDTTTTSTTASPRSPAAANEFSDPLDLLLLLPSRSDLEEPIPDDRYHGIYFAMLLAGVGFLLPYNSFITDVDYLHDKFKGSRLIKRRAFRTSSNRARRAHPFRLCVAGSSIVFDMSLTYILVALLAVILNNVLVERLSMHTRITVGKCGAPTVGYVKLERVFFSVFNGPPRPSELIKAESEKQNAPKLPSVYSSKQIFFISRLFFTSSCFFFSSSIPSFSNILHHLLLRQFFFFFFPGPRIVCELRVLIRKQTWLLRRIFRIRSVQRLRREF